jgi:hypothetical protein
MKMARSCPANLDQAFPLQIGPVSRVAAREVPDPSVRIPDHGLIHSNPCRFWAVDSVESSSCFRVEEDDSIGVLSIHSRSPTGM